RAQGRNEDAMDCYQRALIYNPENFEARIAVADIYRDLGKPQRALATIERLADSHVIESIPARAWMLKGLALADLGQMPDADSCLCEALVCAEDNSDLLIELAEKRLELGHVAEARTVLAQVISHNPNNRQALRLQQAGFKILWVVDQGTLITVHCIFIASLSSVDLAFECPGALMFSGDFQGSFRLLGCIRQITKLQMHVTQADQ
ncbi:MAG: tetratricopeptide repeat protein, partial [Planctomycetota bacterium]